MSAVKQSLIDVSYHTGNILSFASVAGWVMGILPSFAALMAGIWSTILVVDFIMKAKWREWTLFKRDSSKTKDESPSKD